MNKLIPLSCKSCNTLIYEWGINYKWLCGSCVLKSIENSMKYYTKWQIEELQGMCENMANKIARDSEMPLIS